MFTALGESISERAGVLNIGLEGHDARRRLRRLPRRLLRPLGVARLPRRDASPGCSPRCVMVVLCVWLGLDQIVVGIAITLAGEGITSVLYQSQFSSTQPRLGARQRDSDSAARPHPRARQDDQRRVPALQPAADRLPRPRASPSCSRWIFRSTNIGLNLRAAGEKPEALDAAGVSVVATRSYAVLATGALAGLGGAYLAIAGTGGFQDFLTQGQGFMAIVIAMLARGRPLGVVVCSLIFGIALSLSAPRCRSRVSTSRPTSSTCCPFAAIIVALILFARRAYLPPALAPAVRARRPLKGAPDARSRFHPLRRADDGLAARARRARRADRLPLRPGLPGGLPAHGAEGRPDLPDGERRPADAGRGGARPRGRGARRWSGRERRAQPRLRASSARAWATG